MGTVVSAAIGFVVVWAVVRIVGKRGLSELSAFDLVLVIVLGDLVSTGIMREDTSLTAVVVALSTFALLAVASSWLSWRFRRARVVLEGVPTLLINDGEIVHEALKAERVNLDDLLEAARQGGHADLSEIRWAVLEVDGKFSFFPATAD